MGEFINLKQGDMSVKEYDLKFSFLYMYAPSLVGNPRDLINRFMTGVSKLVKEEYCATILVYDKYIPTHSVFSTNRRDKIMKEKTEK